MRNLRRALGRAYMAAVLFRLNQFAGACTLLFFRLVYPDLSVGRGATIWGRFEMMIMPGGRITIGDHLHMVSSPARYTITLYSRCSLTAFGGGAIHIGNRVGLNGTAITSKKRIEIGDGTMIAANVIVVDSDFHTQWPPEARWTTSTAATDAEVRIGRNVWIGMNTLVLKGSTIGDGAIIGAGSVVVGDIPPNVIAAGNPARVLRALGPDAGAAP